MAPRLVTSEPRPSIRHTGYHYVYYNAKTARGTDCVAVIPSSLVGTVRRGFAFDDEHNLRWSDELRASVLAVDFEAPPEGEPSLPHHRTGTWMDSDVDTAIGDPALLQEVAARNGIYPTPARTQSPAPMATKLDPALEELLDVACAAFTHVCKRIGVSERSRAMEAQKIVVTCLIPYLKARGISLTEDDEKAMSY